ncbi:MAG: hypothetical protein IKO03_14525 [Lachnospiraceae bacterium]|nr:hypothetical protein [Lachnospiraceae bacterium]
MDVTITNNLKVDEPDDDIMVGDNAMSVKRGASFLMGYDPYQDPEKPVTKASIGDAPMGEKPTENPLDIGHLSLSSDRNSKSSYAGDTNIAKASSLGSNPLGLNPLGLSEEQLELLGINLQTTAPAPAAVKESASVSVKESASAAIKESVSASVKQPELKKAKEPKEASLFRIISLSDPNFTGGRVFSINFAFEDEDASDDVTVDETGSFVQVPYGDGVLESALGSDDGDKDMGLSQYEADDFKPLGGQEEDEIQPLRKDDEDDGGGLIFMEPDSEDDDPMGLMYGMDDSDVKSLGSMDDTIAPENDSQKNSSSEKKSQAKDTEEMDPLKALLLAGGNPFGENSRIIAPDLSFGKEALKPKHFEPMKASGPKVNAENARENNPLGSNPFGKDVEPDFSFGKDALKPKKYTPKKPYEEK